MGNLPNGNSDVSFNNFTDVPYIPYKIIQAMYDLLSFEAWKTFEVLNIRLCIRTA